MHIRQMLLYGIVLFSGHHELEYSVHNNVLRLSAGDSFEVPPGNRFMFANRSRVAMARLQLVEIGGGEM